MAATIPRPNIADLFQNANAKGLSNSKHKRLFQSLQWRQSFQNRETYDYILEDTTAVESSNRIIKIRQIQNGELKGLGTGTFVWPAAHILSKYLEKRFARGDLRGKYVCDIGSGTGLTGIIASILGGNVVLSDQHLIIPLLTENVSSTMENFPSIKSEQLVVQEYDWDNKIPLSESEFDFLLVSDCVLPKLYPINKLVDAVDFIMGKNTVAFFSYEHRPFPLYDPRQEFQRLCELKDMIVQVVPLANHHSVYCAEDIEIWEVFRKGSTAAPCTGCHQSCIFSSWGEEKSQILVEMDGIQILINQISSQGIGGVLWPSSAVASRIILSSSFSKSLAQLNFPCWKANLKAIDLGSGCGLTAMALHRRNFSVIATDKKIMLGLLSKNIGSYISNVNSRETNIEVFHFEWDKLSEEANVSIPISMQDPDLVVCSDCLYDSNSVAPLIQTIELLTNRMLYVLLVNEMRTALEEFLYFARRRVNFSVEIKDIEILQPDLELVRTGTEVKFAPPIRAIIMIWEKM